MQVKYDLRIGEDTITIIDDVKNHSDFFKKLSFYQSLPKVGPNGETDLKLVYRNPKGYEYYSIVSEKAGMELKFGQLTDPKGDLFIKDWEPVYQGDGQQQQAAAPVVPGVQPQQAVPTPAPAPQQTTPAVDNTTGVAQAPQVTAQQPVTPAAPPAGSPQVEDAVAAAMNRFEIN